MLEIIGPRLLVKKVEEQKQESAKKILLYDERPTYIRCEVITVGKDKNMELYPFAEGQTLLVEPYCSGKTHKINDEEFLLCTSMMC